MEENKTSHIYANVKHNVIDNNNNNNNNFTLILSLLKSLVWLAETFDNIIDSVEIF